MIVVSIFQKAILSSEIVPCTTMDLPLVSMALNRAFRRPLSIKAERYVGDEFPDPLSPGDPVVNISSSESGHSRTAAMVLRR